MDEWLLLKESVTIHDLLTKPTLQTKRGMWLQQSCAIADDRFAVLRHKQVLLQKHTNARRLTAMRLTIAAGRFADWSMQGTTQRRSCKIAL